MLNVSLIGSIDVDTDLEQLLRQIKQEIEENIEERVSKLEQLVKIGTLRSCAEYSRYGIVEDGEYYVDPDGPLIGSEPFLVFCNFTQGSTEIYNDMEMMTVVEHCHEPGCFEKTINYINGENKNDPTIVPLNQMLALLQISERCEQSFTYDCTLAPLRNNDIDLAFWEDRNGEKNNYFTGSNFNYHVCDCFYDENGCVEAQIYNNTCNCDANIPEPFRDTGIITNNTALPITKIYFGGLNYEIQSGEFSIGRLKCFGEKTFEPGTSCNSLKKSGVFASGHYAIKPQNADKQVIAHCQMDSETYEDVQQTDETDLSALSPLGTILPWVNKIDPHGIPIPLPEGWAFCNGSSIKRGPWKGQHTPDINGAGLFLRGGNEANMLEKEHSQLEDHEHIDNSHNHGCSASSSTSQHTHTFYDDHMESSKVDCGGSCWSYHADGQTARTDPATVHVTTTCSTTSHSSNMGGVFDASAGAETRPANMKVLFIIRIF